MSTTRRGSRFLLFSIGVWELTFVISFFVSEKTLVGWIGQIAQVAARIGRRQIHHRSLHLFKINIKKKIIKISILVSFVLIVVSYMETDDYQIFSTSQINPSDDVSSCSSSVKTDASRRNEGRRGRRYTEITTATRQKITTTLGPRGVLRTPVFLRRETLLRDVSFVANWRLFLFAFYLFYY